MNNIINVPQEYADLGVLWVCLNSVNFTGNEEAEEEHRRLLLIYRRKMAKVYGCKPKEIPSEMIEHYDYINKERCKKYARSATGGAERLRRGVTL